MSVNSSSSSDPLPNLTAIDWYYHCFTTRPIYCIYITFVITNIFLLLPLCIFILHRGVQQWLQKRSSASMSHSDCFTYHMVVIELICISGYIIICCGIYSEDRSVMVAGDLVVSFTLLGQQFFHSLTCVERYLAVVHPITYLSLRNEKGVRIRNISLVCVWLLCFVGLGLTIPGNFSEMEVFPLALNITIISFCSLSVLCVLIRPGPGEQGGGRKSADQSKQRAFCTMMIILSVLVVRFSWGLLLSIAFVSMHGFSCVLPLSEGWINLPSSLVLPLLFLHKEGKLVSCRNNVH